MPWFSNRCHIFSSEHFYRLNLFSTPRSHIKSCVLAGFGRFPEALDGKSTDGSTVRGGRGRWGGGGGVEREECTDFSALALIPLWAPTVLKNLAIASEILTEQRIFCKCWRISIKQSILSLLQSTSSPPRPDQPTTSPAISLGLWKSRTEEKRRGIVCRWADKGLN